MNEKDNHYLYECPWCGASAGQPCMDTNGKEYKHGSFHSSRLMKDCREYKPE